MAGKNLEDFYEDEGNPLGGFYNREPRKTETKKINNRTIEIDWTHSDPDMMAADAWGER